MNQGQTSRTLTVISVIDKVVKVVGMILLCVEGKLVDKDSFVSTVVEEVTSALSDGKEPLAVLNIGGISREMLVDSGSASNLVNMGDFNKLVHKGLKVELQQDVIWLCGPSARSNGAIYFSCFIG